MQPEHQCKRSSFSSSQGAKTNWVLSLCSSPESDQSKRKILRDTHRKTEATIPQVSDHLPAGWYEKVNYPAQFNLLVKLNVGKQSQIVRPLICILFPPRLNAFLDGGLPVHKVIELRGDLMSGKTLFCLNIALDLLRIGKRLLYIDTDYGMCSTVFFDLLQDVVDENEISELMKSIDICFVNDYQELVSRLDRLYATQKDGGSDYDFLVIDSIISPLAVECLSLKTAASSEATHEKINLFIDLITKLLTASLTILTTNTSKANYLPRSWTNRCDLVLELTKKETTNSNCMFELRTIKPFRCLNSLSCSRALNDLILSDNFDSQGDQKSNGCATPDSSFPFHSLSIQSNGSAQLNSFSAACNRSESHCSLIDESRQASFYPNRDQAENGLLPVNFDLSETDQSNERDSSLRLDNAVFTYMLTDRGAINVID